MQWTNYTWVGGGDSGPGSWQISSVETDCFADPRMPGDDGGRGGGGGLDPDLSKKFIAKIKCNLGSQQVIQALEANFSSFANYSSADNKSYTVFTPGPISGGERLGIDSTVSIPFIPRVFTSDTHAVDVTSVGQDGFTFQTVGNGQHPLYPGEISFGATDSGNGQINFTIDISGDFASVKYAVGFLFGGDTLREQCMV